MGSLAAILNALVSKDAIVSFTASGNITVRDAEGQKIGKVITEDGEWIAV